MIEFKNVSKVYSNTVALSDITIHIEKNEFIFLVGSSGAGKSTFIKLLLKEISPSSGEILIAGKNINEITKKQLPYYRRKVGMVFQDFKLIPSLNVYENVAFAMRVIGATPKEIRKRVPSVLTNVGLLSKFKCFPDELSGGEQQRVSLARAIVNEPSIIIADEPTGNLDPVTSKEIMELLLEINKSGTTIIMATHDKELVNKSSKRVIEINSGNIIRDERRGSY